MMSDGTGGLVVIVPSRGRPHTVAELGRAFQDTCSEYTRLLFVIDGCDPAAVDYRFAWEEQRRRGWGASTEIFSQPHGTMVTALNAGAARVLEAYPQVEAIAFMGDDHRPRTEGWDVRYLEALRTLPGFVYGDDLLQGPNLPTQVAISARVVRALGHMAPPVLTHLFVDNYWRDLGRTAGCITYLPDVVIEHVHPVAGKAPWDEGHRRVNRPELYEQDRAAYLDYMAQHLPREVLAVRQAVTR